MEYTTEEAAARDKKTAQERARLQIAESDIRGAIERIRFFEGQDGQGHFTAAREYLEMALTEVQKGREAEEMKYQPGDTVEVTKGVRVRRVRGTVDQYEPAGENTYLAEITEVLEIPGYNWYKAYRLRKDLEIDARVFTPYGPKAHIVDERDIKGRIAR